MNEYKQTIDKVNSIQHTENGALTVSIEKEPRRIRGYMDFITKEELARVKEWIKMNFDTLMDYWADADLAKLRGDLKIV